MSRRHTSTHPSQHTIILQYNTSFELLPLEQEGIVVLLCSDVQEEIYTHKSLVAIG
jgi:hypothetical protein